MHKVFLSLGSNLGDREKYLFEAVDEISKIPDVSIIKVSNIYETEPVGYLEQGKFLNMALKLHTELEPLKLLEHLQKVENMLKRTREIHWGPRTIDIDILMMDDLRIDLEELIIPHPRMFERAFVLIPLMELIEREDSFIDKIKNFINNCTDKNGVIFYKKAEEIFCGLLPTCFF
ncbi:2-amino-4-hydroxy-6-hydroxymethyldihydropteridine diphosphokinase [Acetivibrio clariflavus]|uniref:2-amino-4-hydroxy-6-hydroxymethyldihydropteridine diphosphokinase n=1 Tax=Acetivibrio clariflavus (strain DSM 19732 / NBRC 101661 / EBR45) TaxID=720554 RepID=G8LSW4_ACECE|nr:2-amino-4-hydroxy-6-hydroxymethyldihydropteridine diphosphokinase [Acetivibrio clariflavus]AEV70477.1 2-amino-4-hydroxy-6-hydroxymethyldihydropteridine pyrophosphokinase [Acetivibrio clariflavus DSM 19732]